MEWISGGKLVSHVWDCEQWKAALAVTEVGSGVPWCLVRGGLGEVSIEGVEFETVWA